MRHKTYLLCALCILSMLANISCSSTNQASARTGATGYHKGKYYLNDSENNLTIEQLQARIKDEARVCADPHANRIQKSSGSTALQLGTGVIFGVGMNPDGRKVSPAAVSRAKMWAYSDKLVELGQPQASLAGEIEAAIVERNAALEVPLVEPQL